MLSNFLVGEYDSDMYQHKWIHCIKDLLIYVGRIGLLHKETIENPKLIKMELKKTLSVLSIREWDAKVTSSSNGKTYSMFKNNIDLKKNI